MTATPGLLERYRAFHAVRAVDRSADELLEAEPQRARSIGRARERATRLADLLDGAVEEHPDGLVVRVELPPLPLPLDRTALASLPFPSDPERPFVCLDTETTGLATGAGTVVFLVGLGRWDGARFQVTQLFLPDHADEGALLTVLASELPPGAWLVSYNGRSFDWPLLEARYRLHRRVPPGLAGHLDLLPIARLLFRHRLPDARLGTVEAAVCGVERVDDLPGALVPERYLAFLRHGDPGYLRAVALHNEQDVRSLARLLGHLAEALADPAGRARTEPGDVGRLARAYARARRDEEALACFDQARAGLAARITLPLDTARLRERAWLGRERARLLRRMGRVDEALATWREVAAVGGRAGARAWIEVAKLLEHRVHDPVAALAAVDRADALVARTRLSGLVAAGLEADLSKRRRRLGARINRGARRGPSRRADPRATGPAAPGPRPGSGWR